MRNRYLFVVATIAASGITACSDAAVDQVTAPPLAATPVSPVANLWPSEEEYEAEAVPRSIGIQISTNAKFTPDSLTFVVEAHITFQWANSVSATVWASLLNKNGTVVNSSEASMSYNRFALPVWRGDTTFVVRVSTNGIKCGLTGKTAYAGSAAAKAIDSELIEITLWQQTIGRTNAADVAQGACPGDVDECQVASRVIRGMSAAASTADCDDDAPAPPPPPPSGGDPVEVCYVIWREFWYYDLTTYRYTFLFSYPIGLYCFVPEE